METANLKIPAKEKKKTIMDDCLHYKRNNAKNTPEYISTLIDKEMNVELLQKRVFRKCSNI